MGNAVPYRRSDQSQSDRAIEPLDGQNCLLQRLQQEPPGLTLNERRRRVGATIERRSCGSAKGKSARDHH